MKRFIFNLVIVTLLISGCASEKRYWHKRSTTLEQANLDCRECWQEANQFTSLERSIYYQQSPKSDDPFLNDAMNSQYIRDQEQDFMNCMRGRGYRLVEKSWLPADARTQETVISAAANSAAAGQ